LAAKNAILIVEFARQLEDQGQDRFNAAVEACRMRLRPILMTSLAFTLGVVPLYIATGAGAELRIALGTAVFWGMIGVTLFGLIFTPIFYCVIRGWSADKVAVPEPDQPGVVPAE
jgi:multidrug efflux pump subunit AcrB